MHEDTLRRWLIEDAGFRGALTEAEGNVIVHAEVTAYQLAVGRAAEVDGAGHVVRSEVRPSPEMLRYVLARHPLFKERWADNLKVDVVALAKLAAAQNGLDEDAVMAELQDILAAGPQ